MLNVRLNTSAACFRFHWVIFSDPELFIHASFRMDKSNSRKGAFPEQPNGGRISFWRPCSDDLKALDVLLDHRRI